MIERHWIFAKSPQPIWQSFHHSFSKQIIGCRILVDPNVPENTADRWRYAALYRYTLHASHYTYTHYTHHTIQIHTTQIHVVCICFTLFSQTLHPSHNTDICQWQRSSHWLPKPVTSSSVHCTAQYTIHCLLYSVQFIPLTVCTLYTIQWTLYTVHYTLDTALYTVHFTLHCTL